MGRELIAEIHLDSICHNYDLAKSIAQPNTKCIAIVKADAYGHGAGQVAKALAKKADAFGVACIEEALEIRAAGIQAPILLLEGFFDKNELQTLTQNELWTVIHSFKQLEEIEDFANQEGNLKSMSLWLKIDTGMHRLGFQPDQVTEALKRILSLPGIGDVTIMSHFANADSDIPCKTKSQIEVIKKWMSQGLNNANQEVELTYSLSNTAGTLAWPSAHMDWIRPGIMLYGLNPLSQPTVEGNKLKPGMTLSTKLIAIRDVPAGDSVGYGSTYYCENNTRIGTIAIGYADGYSRHAHNGTPVFLNGRRARIAGRVSMDMVTIDLSDHHDAKIGDRVELWGQNLPIDEVAHWCDTIPYTLLSGLTRRVKRRYSMS